MNDKQKKMRAAAGRWKKASRSGGNINGQCVEINHTALPNWVGIRDSKLGHNSPILIVSRSAFAEFCRAIAKD